jgi:Primase C terminal 2 (PriCT-2).
MDKFDLIPLLDYISPDDYQVWTDVGMALKVEGYSLSDWEAWSQRSSKFRSDDCSKRWDGFDSVAGSDGITGATITMYAKQGGWQSFKTADSGFLAWDAVIGSDKVKSIVDESFLDKEEVPRAPVGKDWKPAEQLSRYLNALFQPDDIVGYCTQSTKKEKDGVAKYVPANSGVFSRTAGEILDALKQYGDDLSFSIGNYTKEAGAWIRINPLDGSGVLNSNVSEFRYALVESDDIDIDKQYSIIKQMKLPLAALVHSGGKSLHAIVKLHALSKEEYSTKVKFLYQVCEKSGLKVDVKNKNPSRLSRMPGVQRGKNKQYLIGTDLGCASWDEWVEYVTLLDNALPDPEDLSDLLGNPPELASECIEGVLRQGHKMLIAGASKAGKSFLLMELCLAISHGTRWIKWKCKKGKVLYINLEIDRASCINRFKEIVEITGSEPPEPGTVSIQSLRGMAAPLDKLVDKLIIQAKNQNYSVIILDPIYKVITGDENNASDMANFTNQFDKITEALGCSFIYCHHHSKGSQADKRVSDRASGSGVFARDTDALLDMIELDIPNELRAKITNDKLCEGLKAYYLITRGKDWVDSIPPDELRNGNYLKRYAESWEDKAAVTRIEIQAKERAEAVTAWRVEGTLREFPRFAPINMWFDYPIHYVDEDGLLANVLPIGAEEPHKKGGEAAKKASEQKQENDDIRLMNCYMELAAKYDEVDQTMLIKAFNESKEAEGMRGLDASVIKKKIANSKRLERVNRKSPKGKDLAALIRLKEEEIHEDLPEGFFEN